MAEEGVSRDLLNGENRFLHLAKGKKKCDYSYSSLTIFEIIDRYRLNGYSHSLAWRFALKDVRLRKERMEREKNNLKKY